MRNLVSTIALIVALVAIIISMPVLGAENTTIPTFTNQMEADTAFHSGHFVQYTPFTKAKNQVVGEKRKTETAILAELMTHPHGWRWVIYLPGDELIWKDNTPIGDPRCGNPIRNWAYPSLPTPALEGLPDINITKVIENSFNTTNHYYDGIPIGDKKQASPPLPEHGWCGIFRTNKGCNWATGVILVTAAGVIIATQGNDGKPGPVVHTDPPSLRATLTPRMGFIPPSHGRGGGMFIGGSVSFK